MAEYRKFLVGIKEVINEDNQNKISYLSNLIEGYLLKEEIEKMEGIKRLPWTRTILKKT